MKPYMNRQMKPYTKPLMKPGEDAKMQQIPCNTLTLTLTLTTITTTTTTTSSSSISASTSTSTIPMLVFLFYYPIRCPYNPATTQLQPSYDVHTGPPWSLFSLFRYVLQFILNLIE